MKENDWILLAFHLDGKGGGNPISQEDVIAGNLKDNHWIHLHANYPETEEWLKTKCDVDDLVVQALLAEETRPRALLLENSAVVILRGVNLNSKAEPEDMISIRIYIDKHRMISVRKRRLKSVIDMERALEEGTGAKNIGDLFCGLTSRLFERMEPVFLKLNDDTDDIEQKILEDGDATLRENITDIRKKAIIFKRYLSPQKDVLAKLRNSEIKWLSSRNRRMLQESSDIVSRYVEDMDTIRERTQIVQDELTNSTSDRLNRNTYMLSVIAAIFLPLTFLTGLLGINVAGIPGAENINSFWIFTGILGAIGVLQFLIFKKMKWF